jgi:2-phospho-L-lactate/phosphoenolpyruvate guanylyltransferase
MADVWAVVPVKEQRGAKQRLSGFLPPEQRRALAAAMLEDVLDALAAAPLAGICLVTLDPFATALARRIGARVLTDGAQDGHTGAVMAGARMLIAEGHATMLTVPGDIPRITAAEIAQLIAAHRPAPSFTIAPAHDELGSNAILMSPPDAVTLRFGEDSYFPHLASARTAGIDPTVIKLPGIGMDIDHPADLRMFMAMPRMRTRTLDFLEASGIANTIFPT